MIIAVLQKTVLNKQRHKKDNEKMTKKSIEL